jgi:hypothetical protein
MPNGNLRGAANAGNAEITEVTLLRTADRF